MQLVGLQKERKELLKRVDTLKVGGKYADHIYL